MSRRRAFGLLIVLSVWTLCSRAEEMTKDFDCCEKIPMNRSHENEFFVENTTQAIVTPFLSRANPPFLLQGQHLWLQECVDFDHKAVYNTQSGLAQEDTTFYRSRRCEDVAAQSRIRVVVGAVVALVLLVAGGAGAGVLCRRRCKSSSSGHQVV